jgi:hypothetical protein
MATITVVNDTAEPGSNIYPNGVTLTVKMEKQTQVANPGATVQLQAGNGQQSTINFQPQIVGMAQLSETFFVRDFTRIKYIVSKRGLSLTSKVIKEP